MKHKGKKDIGKKKKKKKNRISVISEKTSGA